MKYVSSQLSYVFRFPIMKKSYSKSIFGYLIISTNQLACCSAMPCRFRSKSNIFSKLLTEDVKLSNCLTFGRVRIVRMVLLVRSQVHFFRDFSFVSSIERYKIGLEDTHFSHSPFFNFNDQKGRQFGLSSLRGSFPIFLIFVIKRTLKFNEKFEKFAPILKRCYCENCKLHCIKIFNLNSINCCLATTFYLVFYSKS